MTPSFSIGHVGLIAGGAINFPQAESLRNQLSEACEARGIQIGFDWHLKDSGLQPEVDVVVCWMPDGSEFSTLSMIHDGWLYNAVPTVIPNAEGVVENRIMFVTDRPSADLEVVFRSVIDGESSPFITMERFDAQGMNLLADRLVSIVKAFRIFRQSPPILDLAGLEGYIWSRLDREFPPLAYHNPQHIQDVHDSALRIARSEGLSEDAVLLLKIATLFHDAGFIYAQERHEERGADLAGSVMPVFGFDSRQVETVRQMILATRVPQKPSTLLEQIICDADLDYLGRDDFYTTGGRLFKELKDAGVLKGEAEWNRMQVGFLEAHRYHTAFGRTYREPSKQARLLELKSKISSLNE